MVLRPRTSLPTAHCTLLHNQQWAAVPVPTRCLKTQLLASVTQFAVIVTVLRGSSTRGGLWQT